FGDMAFAQWIYDEAVRRKLGREIALEKSGGSMQAPELSVKERDRRYAAIRKELREKKIDCAIVRGTNLFYLSNGVKGELFGILPADDRPLAVIVNRRHLIDISPRVLLDAQDWVTDLKPGFDAL